VADLKLWLGTALEESRIPVPVPPAVLALHEILAQAVERLRPRTVRIVRGDGIGCFFQRRETVRRTPHERLDLSRALGLDARHNVNEYERSGQRPPLTFGNEGGHSAHRGAD